MNDLISASARFVLSPGTVDDYRSPTVPWDDCPVNVFWTAQGLAELQMGDLPAWLLLIATASAVVAAVYAGRKAADLLGVERDRDAAQRVAEEQAQASRVAAWATASPRRGAFGRSGHETYASAVEAVVLNNSDQPIYGVVIVWWQGISELKTDTTDVIPPRSRRCWVLPQLEFDTVHGDRASGSIYFNEEEAINTSEIVAERIRIGVSFTDSSNRFWRRSPQGMLEQVATEST